MKELISINDYEGKKAVSARELHAFLESKQDFSHWIKNRITKYGLIENQDYARFDKIIETTGGRLIEYALSIDCAKELAMVEGNAKGKQARRYFIDCEKKLKQVISLPVNKDIYEAKIIVAEFMFRNLNLNAVSKLLVTKSIADPLGLVTPDYVPSNGTVRSATDLFEKLGIACTARIFNQLMIDKGLMVELERPSTSKKAKNGKVFYKSLLGEGLVYGENQTSAKNPKETQPLYYEEKFLDLLELLNLKNIA